MTPEIVQFEIDHVAACAGRENETPERLERAARELRAHPYVAFTGIAGGRVLGSAGISLTGAAEGLAWLRVSAEIDCYRLWFHRTVQGYFRAIVRTFALKRIRAEVEAEKNRAWAEALGFVPIGGASYLVDFTEPRITLFRPAHLRQLGGREGERREETARAVALWRQFPGVTFSMVLGFDAIGAVGVAVLKPGTGYGCTIFNPEIAAHKLWLHRTSKRFFSTALRDLRLERIETHVAADSARNLGWIESLGFRPVDGESFMDAAGRRYVKFAKEDECRSSQCSFR